MAVPAELQIEYIRALIARLRERPNERDSGPLCDRIEANLDALVELLVDPPAAAAGRAAEPEAASEPAPDIPQIFLPTFAEVMAEPPAGFEDVDLAPHDAIPAALTDTAGEVSGAPPEPEVALAGGSVKPADNPVCEVCGRSMVTAALAQHRKFSHTLTAVQTRVIDALRASDGVAGDADKALGKHTGYARATAASIAEKGRLPADVAALLAKHTRSPRKVEPGPSQARIDEASAAERAAIHEVAERIKAREAAPRQNEKTGETFEERRARFARERIAANRASY